MKTGFEISVTLKHFFNSVIDSCVLPGTANGTAILWLYSKQWIREVSIIAVTMISLLSNITPSADKQDAIGHTFVESERSSNQLS